MKRLWKIDVVGVGYSFSVESDDDNSEDVIENARKNNLFEEDIDAIYATAEDITNDDYEKQFWASKAVALS